MSVIIFADAIEGKLSKAAYEAVYYGSKIAAQNGGTAIAVSYGSVEESDLKELGKYGATRVLVNRNLKESDDQQLARLVVKAVEQENADTVIFPYDATGKAIAPRVAAKLKAGLVAGAVELPQTGSGYIVKKSVFSGKAFADYEITTEKKVISVMPNSLKPEATENSAEVVDFTPEVGESALKLVELQTSQGELNLPEAELVVSAGRGLKGPENWGMIEELADTLGAATACSRPVADMGWRPHHEHVGQTGIAIRPDLYIAIGISGAIQHLAGVNGSKTIVVINTDPEAPFFKAADYGIVGDAAQVVPKLTEAFKKFKANH